MDAIENVIGTDFNDRIFGDGAANELHGGAGNDIVTGGIGDDQLFGEDGNDILTGCQNTDLLDGGDGDDRLFIVGGASRDRIFGEGGADSLSGGDGDDLLFADSFDTFISGGDGLDVLGVQSGNGITFNAAVGSVERVFGSNASSVGDVLSAVGGDKTFVLEGRVGNDMLTGGNASDILRGGSGNDVLNGGAGGNDRFNGGGGPGDIFEFNTAWGRDVIEGEFADNGTELIRFAGVSDGTGGALDFGDLQFADNGGNAVISITGVATHSITILGFDHTRLDATDFAFV